MSLPPANENPGVGAPGLEFESKIQPTNNARIARDQQVILRDGLWELASIFTGCGVAAMAAAGGGSIAEIEAALTSARLSLIEGISTFKELKRMEGTP